GISCAHLYEVGRGVDISIFQASMQSYQTPDSLNPATFFTNFIQNTLINPFKAFSDGNVLAVVVFAIFLCV
ncbi:dicarboxylate/amino acid:cation symporter, partial [Acinetobacter baumannii]